MKSAIIFALVACLGCGATVPVTGGDAESIATDATQYPAYTEQTVGLSDGFHGVVKLTAEHTFKEGDVEDGFVAQGAGSLLVSQGKWFVLTARHIVIPDAEIKAIGDTKFDDVDSVNVRVAVSSTGLEPEAIWFSAENDVALLAVREEDRALLLGILNKDGSAPIPLRPHEEIHPGRVVEAWGFPSKHLPQVQKPSVSAISSGYFVLNQSLSRGYSGGPVLVEVTSGKVVGGLIIRADDEAEQTTVLDLSTVLPLVQVAAQGKPDDLSTLLPVPGEVSLGGVTITAGQTAALPAS